ncbi:hypothetical protein FHR88_001632 [Bradyrhizobium betae]|nr:hypothetical protein [Bradyrhizobium betae]
MPHVPDALAALRPGYETQVFAQLHQRRYYERSEAIQSPSPERFWIASLRSQ